MVFCFMLILPLFFAYLQKKVKKKDNPRQRLDKQQFKFARSNPSIQQVSNYFSRIPSCLLCRNPARKLKFKNS